MVRKSVVKTQPKGTKARQSTYIKIDVPFSAEEADRYRRFVATRKAGQVVRSLLVRAMDEADGIASSCGEARELAAFIASLTSEQFTHLKTTAKEQVEAAS